MAKVNQVAVTLDANSSRPRKTAFQNRRKIELFVECNDLIQLDKFSKSDPLCVLSVKRLGHWTEVGRTESIPNNLNPRFVESFILEPCATLYPRLRFSLYDLANFTSKDLQKHDFIGCTEIDIDTLLGAELPCVRTLRVPGDIKTRGYIRIIYEDTRSSSTHVRLQISGLNFEKKGLLSKWDAYFELERWFRWGHSHPVYRSEIVTRTLDPRWAPFDLALHKLCNEDVTRKVTLSCWHFSSNGTHTLIGQASFTVEHVIKRTVKVLNMVKPQKSSKSSSTGRRPTNSGVLRIDHCHVDKQHSLVDYVMGGCQIHLTCAIDFTLSNGDPTLPHSLHSTLHENNEYIHALEALVPSLTYYDDVKTIPVFGFGAKNNGDIPYCFALNGCETNPELSSTEDIITTYTTALSNLKLGGPTYLAPVIKRLAEYAKKEVSQDSQYYLVAMVIMDGVANDLDDTVNEIVRVSGLPLTIIVVGVGPADFTSMETLLVHQKKPLRSKDHGTMVRKNTYFVAMQNHGAVHSRFVSTEAREALANVSRQIVEYFKCKSIDPNPQTKSQVVAAWERSRDMPNGTVKRPSSPRLRSTSAAQIPRCPTCGSLIENNNLL